MAITQSVPQEDPQQDRPGMFSASERELERERQKHKKTEQHICIGINTMDMLKCLRLCRVRVCVCVRAV